MREANKEAAEQCLEVAERALAAGDLEKAERFVQKAQRLFSTDAVRAGARWGLWWGAVSPAGRPAPLAACCSARLHVGRQADRLITPTGCRLTPAAAAGAAPLRLQARLLQQRIKRAAEAGSSAANGRAHGAGPAGMGGGPNLRQRHTPAGGGGGAGSSRRHEPPPDEDHKVGRAVNFLLPDCCPAAAVGVATPHERCTCLLACLWVQATPEQRELVARIRSTTCYYEILVRNSRNLETLERERWREGGCCSWEEASCRGQVAWRRMQLLPAVEPGPAVAHAFVPLSTFLQSIPKTASEDDVKKGAGCSCLGLVVVIAVPAAGAKSMGLWCARARCTASFWLLLRLSAGAPAAAWSCPQPTASWR